MEVVIRATKAAVEQYVRTTSERAAGVVRDPLVQARAAELAREIGRAWGRNGGPVSA